MVLIVIIILFYIPTLFVYYFSGRRLLYPATVFSSVYAAVLTLACIANAMFNYYPISLETYAIYGLGNVVFIISGLCCTYFFRESTKKKFEYNYRKLKIVFLILLFISAIYAPVIYSEFIAATPNMPLAMKILRTREKGLTEQVFSTLTNNIIIVSTLSVMLATYLFSRKTIGFVAFSAAYAMFAYYNFLTGTRSAIILVSLSCLIIYALSSEKINKKFLLLTIAITFLLGAFIAIFMGKDGMDRNSGLMSNMSKVVDNYFSYTVQGTILFNNYVVGSEQIHENWDILSGPKELVNKIIPTFDLEEKYSDFSKFSPIHEGNVYTIYFAIYPIYGVLGVVFFFLLYGFICSFVYEKFNGVSVIIVAYINAALCLSIFNEQVFINFIFTIKMIAFVFLCHLLEKKRNELFGNNRLV